MVVFTSVTGVTKESKFFLITDKLYISTLFIILVVVFLYHDLLTLILVKISKIS